MDKIRIASTQLVDISHAVEDVKKGIGDQNPVMLIYFASSSYNPDQLSAVMQDKFPSSTVFGCQTSGEIISGKMMKNSVVAMGFSKEMIGDVKVEVITDIDKDPDIKGAFRSFGEYFDQPMVSADLTKYFGIVLMDGLSAAEEKVMDRIGDLSNLTIIGGSAGDDLKFEKTYIYANGKAYRKAALIAMCKANCTFDVIKTQSFQKLDKKLTATKVNLATREVLEFDGLPAVERYAAVLDVPKSELSNRFMSNPVGLIADDEIFVRSPQRTDENKVVFYCNLMEGMEVSVLQSTDIVKDTRTAIEEKKKELGNISAILNFHCILRTLELENIHQTQEYGKVFENIPTIGFSTYGEAFLGHINQTSAMIVFK